MKQYPMSLASAAGLQLLLAACAWASPRVVLFAHTDKIYFGKCHSFMGDRGRVSISLLDAHLRSTASENDDKSPNTTTTHTHTNWTPLLLPGFRWFSYVWVKCDVAYVVRHFLLLKVLKTVRFPIGNFDISAISPLRQRGIEHVLGIGIFTDKFSAFSPAK